MAAGTPATGASSLYRTPLARRVVQAVSIFVLVAATATVWAAYRFFLAGDRDRLIALTAAWTLLPPAWFWVDYFLVFRPYGDLAQFEKFQHGQQVSAAIWAAMALALGVLASSNALDEKVKQRLESEAVPQAEVATTLAFGEGPTADRDGNIYFTDIINQRIMKLGADGVLSTYRQNSNAANGLLIDPQGRLIACEGATFERPGVKVSGTPRVTRTDLKTGSIEVLAERYEGKPLVGPNDVTIDSKGRLYFTDLNGAAVYRIDAPGTLTRILAAPDIQRPNGIQISPDDQQLYLVESNQAAGGARLIRAYDLHADGTVGNMRVHFNFSPGRSADGMSIDSQGNLYASAGMNQPRGSSETLDNKTGVYVISPAGKLLRFIPIAEDYITNNAFGGTDMKTLYVTAGKTLYRVRTEIAGLPR